MQDPVLRSSAVLKLIRVGAVVVPGPTDTTHKQDLSKVLLLMQSFCVGRRIDGFCAFPHKINQQNKTQDKHIHCNNMTIIKSSSPLSSLPTPATKQQSPGAGVSIETELSKTLNISWADARDLASYAGGKLDIIPGDSKTERRRRNSIIRCAIEADKQFPRKRIQKRRKVLSEEEKKIKKCWKPEHNNLIRRGYDMPRRYREYDMSRVYHSNSNALSGEEEKKIKKYWKPEHNILIKRGYDMPREDRPDRYRYNYSLW